MKQTQRTFLIIVVFVFGIVAGVGAGFLYGQSMQQGELTERLALAEAQLDTLNESHMVLIQEYNKLFRLRAEDWVPPVTVLAAPERPGTPIGPEGIAGPNRDEDEVAEEMAPTPTEEAANGENAASEETDASEEAVTEEAATEEGTAEAEAAGDSTAEEDAATDSGEMAPPVADFDAESVGGTDKLAGPPPQPFRFMDLSTGEITSWEWNFGDGETSTEQNPEHTIRKCPGMQELCTVSLTVCGPGGCDTETKLDYIWVSESCTGC